MIRAQGACLTYFDHGGVIHACRDVTAEIADGEFVGILGPSGSGKSSLLYLLSGLKDPTSGSVSNGGKLYSSLQESERSNLRLREFGFVFQQPFLLGYLSAIENVLLASPKASRAEAVALFGELGIAGKERRLPSELSGGEKQRVCVARALLPQPKFIFADEPTASLDHRSGEQVVELLARHRKGALVMVTHDPSMLRNADRVIAIEAGVAVELSAEERSALSNGHSGLLHSDYAGSSEVQ